MSNFVHDGFESSVFDEQIATGCESNRECSFTEEDYANPYSPNYDAKRDPYINPSKPPISYAYSYNVDPNEYVYRPYEKLANAAFIISLLSFAFPFMSILSLIFGIITYNKTTMNSEKQLFSRVAVAISVSLMAFYLFLLLFVIVLSFKSNTSYMFPNTLPHINLY